MALADDVLRAVEAQELGREGADELRLVCPSHQDTADSPNATYNPRKQVWTCMSCGAGGGYRDLAKLLGIRASKQPAGTIVTTYPYVDEQGALLFEVVRMDPKDFRQRRRSPAGRWIWNLEGTRKVLYRLPRVLAADEVWIVEGEKDVHTAEAWGLTATCNPGGAAKGPGKWLTSFSDTLKGKRLYIIPDADKDGEDHAVTVANSVSPHAREVRVVRLPGLDKKGDLTDWAVGRSVEALLALKDAAPIWQPTAPPEEEPAVLEFPLTDAGNAELFAERYGDRVRYDWQRNRWLTWQGHRWGVDKDGSLYKWAIESARHRRAEAEKIESSSQREKALGFARGSENAGRVENCLKLARAVDPVADSGLGWDEQPWLLACENGVINLATGELEKGRPEQRLTQSVGYAYDPRATAPVWEGFVADLFPDNPELVPWFQKVLGYTLTGSVREQVVFLLHGRGANGKSTFLDVLTAVMGEYSGTIAFRTIEQGYDKSIPSDMAALVGKRAVYASETKEGSVLNEARVKSLSGGDRITARFLRENEFSFSPVLKLFIAVNHRPTIKDDSEGMWRRIRLVPFNATFDSARRDLEMKGKLLQELPGILRWMVAGALRYREEGLGCPAVVAVATADYREQSDPMADWLAACTIAKDDTRTKGSSLYRSYKTWAEEQGLSQRETLSVKLFGRRLGEDWNRVKVDGIVYYRNIVLRREDSDPQSSLPDQDPQIQEDPEKGGREGGRIIYGSPQHFGGRREEGREEGQFSVKSWEGTFFSGEEPQIILPPSLPPSPVEEVCGCGACPRPLDADEDCAGVPFGTPSHCTVCHNRKV